METQLNINVRASTNKTGSTPDADWIMESDNTDIRDVYFTSSIQNYPYSFFFDLSYRQNHSQLGPIYSTDYAFAALNNDGTVVAWGAHGGSDPHDQAPRHTGRRRELGCLFAPPPLCSDAPSQSLPLSTIG